MIRKIFSYIYVIYSTTMFVLTFFVAIIPISLFSLFYREPARIRRNHRVFKIWMDVYLFLIGSPVRRSGMELFDESQAYVVVANHNNFLDITLTSPYIPQPVKTLAKKELDKFPIFNILYRAGSVLIDRKSVESRAEAFEEMRYFIANGVSLCIFPEGTRNKSEEVLLRFKDGAFRLAMEENVAVIMAVLRGTRTVNNLNGTAKPTRLKLDFICKVYPQDFDSPMAMRDHCRDQMKSFLEEQGMG